MERRDFLKVPGAAGLLSTSVASSSLWPAMLSAQQIRPMIWGGTVPLKLDPHDVIDVPTFFFKNNCYDALYEYVAGKEAPELKMRLVRSAKASADGTVWDFELVENIRFQDGSVMSAEDVVYSFKRMLAVGTATSAMLRPMLGADSVTASSAAGFRIRLTSPYAPFLAILPLLPIVNSKLVIANTKDNDWGKAYLLSNSAGSGPYKVVPGSFKPIDRFDLEWFPDYFRGWPLGDRSMKLVLDRYIKDNTTHLLAVKKGDIDGTNGYVPPDQFADLEKTPGVRMSIEPALRTFMMRMNHRRAPFDNIHFRRAVSCAFPYDTFIEKVMMGNVDRIQGPIPHGIFGSPKDLKGYRYDLKQAREHLDRAARDGVNLKQEIEFVALTSYDETVAVAQLLQSELRKLGVTLKISKAIWANLVTATQKPETSPQIWSHWSTPYYVDPDNWTGPYYTKSGHGTTRGSSWYSTDKVEQLLGQAMRETSQDRRTDLYEQASRVLVEDAVDVWIYRGKVARALRTRVKGYEPAVTGDGIDLRKIWVES
jgi:peptide/nickel transport system substrate-binding protein